MNDLIKKLNVLVKASLNDRISGGDTAKLPRLGKKLDDDIQSLRQRVNEAVEYEDEIQARIRQFEDEAARWDRQVDEALTKGDDAAARYAVEQMKRAEQRAILAQSDLREHQQATQELIQRVNTLEAVVADASRAQTESAQTTHVQSENTQTEDEPPQKTAQIPDLGNVLRDARDKISALGETTSIAREDRLADSQENAATVDNDLEQRRQRLSKR